MPGIHDGLRPYLRSEDMIVLTIGVTACIIVYLFTALVRPEWF
jgi:F subunit of K+-transporting ATPase (Potass_KdpF)